MKELLSLLITICYAIPLVFLQTVWEGQFNETIPFWFQGITGLLVYLTSYLIVRKIYD